MASNFWENKWLQVIAASIIIYFVCMDISLLQSLSSTTQTTKDSAGQNHSSPISQIAMKTLLLDHANHYIHVPLAVLFTEATNFSQVFPSITPNIISVSHVFVAILGMRLVCSELLSVRQVGVLLFEVRSFLDALDGAVARSRGHHSLSHVEIGSSGFFVDGICDTFGSVALYIGVLFFLRSRAGIHMHRTKTMYSPLPSTISQTQAPKDSIHLSPNPFQNIPSINTLHDKRVLTVVICSAMQMLLSSIFWNRTLDAYHSLLETETSTPLQKEYQIQIFRSHFLWITIWCWRLCNPHALLEMILISIFVDKLWEFLRWTQYLGFVIVIFVTAITQVHINSVQRLIASGLQAGR